MLDFSCIDWFGGDFIFEQSIVLYQVLCDWFVEQLVWFYDGLMLVVSYYVFSVLLILLQFVGNLLLLVFVFNFDELVVQVDYWLYGYVYDVFDYCIGWVWVLVNLGGYFYERGGFCLEFVFEV